MIISYELAQDIVSNIKEILNQEINYIDTNGIIIASTDANRIGSDHEGAKLVVETKKELIIDQDNQWKGARKGINFPVFFNKEIVGIIGITGNKQDVLQYGKILQKMTEILVKEAYVKDLQSQQKRNQKVMVERILNYDEDDTLQDTITNFIEHKNRKIIIGKTSYYLNADKENRIHSILNSLPYHEFVELFTISGDLIILFCLEDIAQQEVLHQMFRNIKDAIHQNIYWGIGTHATTFSTLKNSYHSAKMASIWGRNVIHNVVCEYDQMELGILLSELPYNKGQYFLNKVFEHLNSEQIIEMQNILQNYETYNGSITQCAQALFIHKNTLQYQLLKIKKDTGYDPRNLHDFLILKSALLLYKLYTN